MSGDQSEKGNLHGKPRNRPAGDPVAGIFANRYQIDSMLGEGGMGKIYKAYDLVLQRQVALKFVRADDPEMEKRLLREAQAQAKVEHENVCEIYDLGQSEGHYYIAMHYVEGVSLEDVRQDLSFAEIAELTKAVAEGIHAAHQMGLIHRDIKPSNIMLESTGEGTFKPVILDFGLVRDITRPDQSKSGTVHGTPFYMSPEQAMGETSKVDARCDLYSLGATLYQFLTKRPPFEGTAVDVFMKLIEKDPESPRKLNPSIPVELESIVMKCLEKDPARRYNSALEMAQDLKRYLSGEPVLARPVTWSYRAWKRVRKNKNIAALMAGMALVLMILAGITTYTMWKSRYQARLVEEFGEDARQIEELLRHANTAPLHDVRDERAKALSIIRNMESKLSNVGRAGLGPGHYGVGRGFLAMEDYASSLHHLQKAREHGYQNREVAYALGLTLAEMYQEAVREAEKTGDPAAREATTKELETRFRDPALEALRESHGNHVKATEYVEATIAFLEKRYDDALQKAKAASNRVPWLYKATKLEGDIYVLLGDEQREQGAFEEANKFYDLAGDAYRKTTEYGRSDPKGYEGLCYLAHSQMQMRLYGEGVDLQPYFDEGMQACGQAIQANPDQPNAFSLLSDLYARKAEDDMLHGNDPWENFQQSIEAAEKSLKKGPPDENTYKSIGNSYLVQAMYDMEHGEDPRGKIRKAVESYQHSVRINSNFLAGYNNLGMAFFTLGSYEMERGIDPRPSLEQSVQALTKVIELSPEDVYAYNNLGAASYFQARFELDHGRDPLPYVNPAKESFKKAIAINSKHWSSFLNIGSANVLQAEYELKTRVEPLQSIRQALDSLQKAMEIDPGIAQCYLEIGKAHRYWAEFEIAGSRNPQPYFRNAFDSFRKGLAVNPDNSEIHYSTGRLALLEARWRMNSKKDPAEAWRRAEASLSRAIDLNPNLAPAYSGKARLRWQQAQWKVKENQSTRLIIEEGLTMVEKSLSIHPMMGNAMALKGALHLLKVQSGNPSTDRDAELNRAIQSLKQALSNNPLLSNEFGPYLEEAQKLK